MANGCLAINLELNTDGITTSFGEVTSEEKSDYSVTPARSDDLRKGDVAAVYHFPERAFVAVAKINGKPKRDAGGDYFVKWTVRPLPRSDWILAEALRDDPAWYWVDAQGVQHYRKPLSMTRDGKRTPQFASPTDIAGARWVSLTDRLPTETAEWLG